ncbi:hypothetical protein GCM10028784_12960 [Myceligenerans cantabricum]
MATRRKRSRGGRSGTRAGSPPTSNALEWAERLASGDPAPEPSALEWAENLKNPAGEDEPAANPWGTTPETTAPAASPFGRTGTDAGTSGGGPSGPHSPFEAALPGAVDAAGGSGDDDGAPGWGPVTEAAPTRRSRRDRGSKNARSSTKTKAGKTDRGGRKGAAGTSRRGGERSTPPGAAPVEEPRAAHPFGGAPGPDGHETGPFGPAGPDEAEPVGPFSATGPMSPLPDAAGRLGADPSVEPGAGGGSSPSGSADGAPFPADEPSPPSRRRRSAGTTGDSAGGRSKRRPAPAQSGRKRDARTGAAPEGRGGRSGARPQRRPGAGGKPGAPSGSRARRLLTKGLPRSADKPTVLIIAAVVAVGLGLGVGWASNLLGGGQTVAATPQQCAAAQTAWTKAANAQTGISEEEPASVRTGFIDARNAMTAVDVPDGIAEDWENAHAFYTTVADALEEKKAGDTQGIAEAAEIASAKVDTDDMIETSKRITRFVNEQCG